MERIELTVDGSAMALHAARPKEAGRHGLLVFQEAFGVNAHVLDLLRRFSGMGFVAVAPELFHRTAAPGYVGSYDDFGASRSHIEALTPQSLEADARASFDWLRNAAGVDGIAAVGFCLGGGVACLSNARLDLAAAVSFYGFPDLELAEQQRAPILMFWGGRDAHIPAEKQRAFADALSAAGKTHEQVVFSQAGHAFFNDARQPNYDAGAARQAWVMMIEFFRAFGALA